MAVKYALENEPICTADLPTADPGLNLSLSPICQSLHFLSFTLQAPLSGIVQLCRQSVVSVLVLHFSGRHVGKCPACGTQSIVKCICQNYQCTICYKSVTGRAGDGVHERITKVGGLVRWFGLKTGLVHHFKDNYITSFRSFSFCTRWSPIIDTPPMARNRSHCSRRSCIPCILCNRTGGGCSGKCVPPGAHLHRHVKAACGWSRRRR